MTYGSRRRLLEDEELIEMLLRFTKRNLEGMSLTNLERIEKHVRRLNRDLNNSTG